MQGDRLPARRHREQGERGGDQGFFGREREANGESASPDGAAADDDGQVNAAHDHVETPVEEIDEGRRQAIEEKQIGVVAGTAEVPDLEQAASGHLCLVHAGEVNPVVFRERKQQVRHGRNDGQGYAEGHDERSPIGPCLESRSATSRQASRLCADSVPRLHGGGG